MEIDKIKLKQLFDSDSSVKLLAQNNNIAYETLKKYFIQEYGLQAFNQRKTRIKKLAMSGDNNYQVRNRKAGIRHWNTKVPEDKVSHIANTGYRMIGTPKWFKGMSNGGFSLEHQVKYCEAYNLTSIPSGYVIHHKDENKLNNELNNLELVSRSDHVKLHNIQKYRIYQRVTTISKESTSQVNGDGNT